MKTGVVLVAVLTLAARAAGANTAPSLSVVGGVVAPGDRIVVHVHGAAPNRRLRVYLVPRFPVTSLPLRVSIGAVVPDRRGNATLVSRLPQLAADVYKPAACCSRGELVTGRGLLSVRALPPAGFGALGASGCVPGSPRNREGSGFAQSEVFGTASGAQFWALGAGQAPAEEATLDGVIGKEEKIIFKLTSGAPRVFYAVAPDGTLVLPLWGPSPHGSSNWNRPGYEWGAAFVFTQPGCWRIHAGAPPAQGDVWLTIRS